MRPLRNVLKIKEMAALHPPRQRIRRLQLWYKPTSKLNHLTYEVNWAELLASPSLFLTALSVF
jgi:hypothetical protein